MSSFFNLTQKSLKNSVIGRWLFEVWRIFWGLIKIMVPAIIVVRLIEISGGIDVLAELIAPVMLWVGLPGEMGLVWVTAIATNIYTSMAVFYQLGGMDSLNVAQVSVLSAMILLCHGLPIEAVIARGSGTRLWFTLLLRIGGAFLYGFILYKIYTLTDSLQTPVTSLWQPENIANDWLSWLVLQGQTLLAALLIIAGLTAIIRLLRYLKIEKLIHLLISPLLRLLNVGAAASNIIIIGLTLGISFGGAILIDEAKSGKIPRQDIFITMAFLGLSHSILEDTLLLLLLGGDIFAIFWGRLIFSLMVIALLVKALKYIPDRHQTFLYCKVS